MIIGAIWKGIYRIGANFLLLHTNFQQNKDCNSAIDRTPLYSTIVAYELPAKQGLQLISDQSIGCTGNVAYELPAKQGLQLDHPSGGADYFILLHTNFQQNKDCNIPHPNDRGRGNGVAYELPAKQGLQLELLGSIKTAERSCIRTSSKTRTATPRSRSRSSPPGAGCIRTSSKTRTATGH